MVPPDGARAKRIPTLSWDSVVAHPATDAAGSVDAAPATPPPVPTSPVPAPPRPPAAARTSVSAARSQPVDLSPLTLDLSAAPDIFVIESDPAPDAVIASGLDVLASAPATIERAPATVERVEPDVEAEPAVARVRTTPPAVIVPALGDVTSGPTQIAPHAPADPLPEIREATSAEQRGPYLPSAPASAPTPATTVPLTFDVKPATTSATQKHRRKGKRRGLKLLATLVVLGGLVAAGVVFGKASLFPGDWDDATAPYADAVESGRGVDFAEPLSIIAEPTADFSARFLSEVAGTRSDDLPTWRALGLASGTVDDATLVEQVIGWQDALYSTVDGQVYHDSGVAGARLDAQLTQAMAASSLDQEYRWSPEQPERTLDGAATTSAEVLRQTRAIQAASVFDGAIGPAPAARLGVLPPLIGYRMLAPQVFAEFASTADDTPNPLSGIDAGGPGPIGLEVPVVAEGPTMIDGDVITASPVAKDRSFWFLVFGAFLDGRTAFSASESVVESALTRTTRGTAECAYATFSGGDVAKTAALRSALTSWAAAAPADFASAFIVLDDGTLQLSSCDPGAGFASGARADVVGELVAWRAVEWATYDAVVSAGGGDVEFANAWGLIGASDLPLEVAALSASASPDAIATAARDGVAAMYVTTD